MTLAAFDIALMKNYNEPKYLLHFQWNDGKEKIYRYALVETMSQSEINHRTKQKEDEVNLTQKEIWLKKYSYNNTVKRQHTYHSKVMAKRKFNLEKLEHERIPKKTSIGRRPKLSSMNKHRKRQKGKSKNRGQGK